MTNVTLVDGHVPNYVNPPTKQPLVMGVQIGMTATALLCVALRLYTRKVLRNVFGAEDWVIIVAMALAIVATICTCLGCKITFILPGFPFQNADDIQACLVALVCTSGTSNQA